MDIRLASTHPRWWQSVEIALCVLCLLAAVLFLLVWGAGCKRASEADELAAGDQAMRAGKLADAEASYQAAVAAAANDPRAHISLSSVYASEQKFPLAETECSKALELDPKNAESQVALGRFYASQSQFPKAEEHYRAAVAIDPTRSSYRIELGSALAKESKQAEAEAEIRAALGLDPKNAKAHLELANVLSAESGKQDEAGAEYAQAKALDPALVPATGASLAGTPAASAAASTRKIKNLNEKFLLTKNSQVFERPDQSSRVVAQVHSNGFVRVTGLSGDWLQIKLRSGTVGFIPATAAE